MHLSRSRRHPSSREARSRRWLRCVTALVALSGCALVTPDGERPTNAGAEITQGGPGADGGLATPPPGSSAVKPCATKLEDWLGALKAPGAVAGIVKDGRLACTSAAGMANVEENRPVTADTVFAIASVSKTVTATALMQLFEEGKFGLDDDVNAYLPFEVAIPACPSKPITFRQLLSHTSSIRDGDAYDDSYGQGDPTIGLGDYLVSYLTPGGERFDAEDNFKDGCPGTQYEYSNVGAGLIGFLVETIGKKPFDQLSRERTLLPLGMTETSWKLAGLDPDHVAMPYESEGGKLTALGHQGYPTYPDGMLRTSVPQLARFLLMFMGGGTFEGTKILAPSTVEEMKRVQVQGVPGDDTDGQGLIWFYDEFATRVLGHDGSDPGTSSYMYYDPERGTGVILFANAEWDDDAADDLMNALFAEAAGD